MLVSRWIGNLNISHMGPLHRHLHFMLICGTGLNHCHVADTGCLWRLCMQRGPGWQMGVYKKTVWILSLSDSGQDVQSPFPCRWLIYCLESSRIWLRSFISSIAAIHMSTWEDTSWWGYTGDISKGEAGDLGLLRRVFGQRVLWNIAPGRRLSVWIASEGIFISVLSLCLEQSLSLLDNLPLSCGSPKVKIVREPGTLCKHLMLTNSSQSLTCTPMVLWTSVEQLQTKLFVKP